MIDINKLVDRFEPDVAAAFLASTARLTDQVRIKDIIAALELGDVERVLALVQMDKGAFEPYERAFRAAYGAGGDAAYTSLVKRGRARGAQVRGFFSSVNPKAQQFIERRSSSLIVQINEGTRTAVRTVLAQGGAPRTAALNLVGRINRATGQREGGVIGLTSGQQAAATNAARDLAEGNLTSYFNRIKRNPTYDRQIQKAFDQTGRVPAELRERAVKGYRNNLLRQRGETIARTELLGGLHDAQDEAMSQMLDREGLGSDAVTETWDAANDADTRDSHAAMDGQQRQRGVPFTTGAGYQLMYPGDRSLGAPAEEIINCRCVKNLDVDWTQMLRRGD